MPRFFFHIRDGKDYLKDSTGGEFDSLSEAHHEAIKLAQSAVRDLNDIGDIADDQAVEVCDEQGAIQEIVSFADACESLPVADEPDPRE